MKTLIVLSVVLAFVTYAQAQDDTQVVLQLLKDLRDNANSELTQLDDIWAIRSSRKQSVIDSLSLSSQEQRSECSTRDKDVATNKDDIATTNKFIKWMVSRQTSNTQRSSTLELNRCHQNNNYINDIKNDKVALSLIQFLKSELSKTDKKNWSQRVKNFMKVYSSGRLYSMVQLKQDESSSDLTVDEQEELGSFQEFDASEPSDDDDDDDVAVGAEFDSEGDDDSEPKSDDDDSEPKSDDGDSEPQSDDDGSEPQSDDSDSEPKSDVEGASGQSSEYGTEIDGSENDTNGAGNGASNEDSSEGVSNGNSSEGSSNEDGSEGVQNGESSEGSSNEDGSEGVSNGESSEGSSNDDGSEDSSNEDSSEGSSNEDGETTSNDDSDSLSSDLEQDGAYVSTYIPTSRRPQQQKQNPKEELIQFLDDLEKTIVQNLVQSQNNEVNSALTLSDFTVQTDTENDIYDIHIHEEQDSIVRLSNQLTNRIQAASLCKARLEQITLAQTLSEEDLAASLQSYNDLRLNKVDEITVFEEVYRIYVSQVSSG